MKTRKSKLKVSDLITQNDVIALKKENAKLQREISTLKVENFSLRNSVKSLKSQLKKHLKEIEKTNDTTKTDFSKIPKELLEEFTTVIHKIDTFRHSLKSPTKE